MNQQTDDDFHDQAISSLYEQSKHEQPPMALDSAILRQARNAVNNNSKPSWFHFNWLIPAASATMILLAITVSWQNRDSMVVSDMTKATVSDMQEVTDHKNMERFAPAAQGLVQPAPAELVMPKQKSIATDQMSIHSSKAEQHENTAGSAHEQRASKKEPTAMADSIPKPAPLAVQPDIAKAEQWLKEIQLLIKNGDKEKALKELNALRKIYPDYPLPGKLKKELNIK